MVHRPIDDVPIRAAVDEMRGRDRVLEKLCAAVMVGVGVRDDDVFDLVDVEAEFFQSPGDLVRRSVVVERLENDDSFAGNKRPGTVDLGAEEVEVVRDPGALGILRRLYGCGGLRGCSWAA